MNSPRTTRCCCVLLLCLSRLKRPPCQGQIEKDIDRPATFLGETRSPPHPTSVGLPVSSGLLINSPRPCTMTQNKVSGEQTNHRPQNETKNTRPLLPTPLPRLQMLRTLERDPFWLETELFLFPVVPTPSPTSTAPVTTQPGGRPGSLIQSNGTDTLSNDPPQVCISLPGLVGKNSLDPAVCGICDHLFTATYHKHHAATIGAVLFVFPRDRPSSV